MSVSTVQKPDLAEIVWPYSPVLALSLQVLPANQHIPHIYAVLTQSLRRFSTLKTREQVQEYLHFCDHTGDYLEQLLTILLSTDPDEPGQNYLYLKGICDLLAKPVSKNLFDTDLTKILYLTQSGLRRVLLKGFILCWIQSKNEMDAIDAFEKVSKFFSQELREAAYEELKLSYDLIRHAKKHFAKEFRLERAIDLLDDRSEEKKDLNSSRRKAILFLNDLNGGAKNVNADFVVQQARIAIPVGKRWAEIKAVREAQKLKKREEKAA